MLSEYETMYSSLLAHLTDLKPLLISTDDEITSLLSASTSDEINTLSTQIAKGVDKIHSITYDYRATIDQIKGGISQMEDQAKKEQEQQEFENKMNSIDGSTSLQLNLVSVTSTVEKLEARFTRCLNTASMRISALSRVTTPDPSHPSMSTIDTPSIESLIQRIRTLETTHTPAHSSNWSAFKYQLDMLILNQAHLNEVEKAYYVRSSLKGAALNLVVTIPTQKNFLSKIIERLELEYDRSSLTQATLLHSLLTIRSKSPKLEDQIEAARSMINLVHTIDPKCGLDGLLTQQQIADRIHPRFISLVWKRKPATLLAALQLIEDALRSELEEITITSAISEQLHPYQHTVVTHFNNAGVMSNRPTAADTHFPSPKVPKGPTCVFCGTHTYSGECTSVTSIKERMDILKTRSLCFCCFSNAHSTTTCSKKCSICAGKHHRSICDKTSHISINTHTVFTHQSDRLFTVDAQISNPDSAADNAITASIHHDHGAQANLITRNLCNRLSLVPFDQREMTIAGFNSGPAHSSTYDIVKLVVAREGGPYPIEAVVVEKSSLNSIHVQPLPIDDLNVINEELGCIPNQLTQHTVIHSELLLSVGNTLQLLENSKVTKLPSGYRLVQSRIGPLVVGRNRTRHKTNDPPVTAVTPKLLHIRSNEAPASFNRIHILETTPITISTITVHPHPHINAENKHSITKHSTPPIIHFHPPLVGPSEDSTVITHCNSKFNRVISDSSHPAEPREQHTSSTRVTTPHWGTKDTSRMSKALVNVLLSPIDHHIPIASDSISTHTDSFIVKGHIPLEATVSSLIKHPTIPPSHFTHCGHSHIHSSHSTYRSIHSICHSSAHHNQLGLPHTSDPPLSHNIDRPDKLKSDSDVLSCHHCYPPP